MKGRGKSSLQTRSTKSLELKEIAGNTCTHNRHFAHSPQGRVVAYAAASAVVLYNYQTKEQTVLAAGAGEKDVKLVSCLSFSWDGKYLAVGRCGHLPTVGVYDASNGTLLTTLKSIHSFGVACVQFSKGERSRYLATLGYTDDSYVCVWDWAANALAPIAACSLVGSLSLSPLDDASASFAVCGKRHISIVSLPNSHTSDTLTIREAIIPTLDVRALSLGVYSDSTFIDVSSSNKHIYAVSTSGNLISASGGKIEKWVKLKSPYAFSLSATDGVVVCGCSDATLRIFEAGTLSYLGTLPRAYAFGSENIFIQTKKCSTARQKGETYADVIGCRLSADGASVACVYSDRTMMFWDISDAKKPQVSSFLFAHNGSVWGIEALPTDFGSSPDSAYPNATHVTSSADGSLRFWRASAGHPRFDCIGVLPVTQPGAKMQLSDHLGHLELPPERGECGLRSLRISPDHSQLAVGDANGNVHVYSLPTCTPLFSIPAHDGEVLQLDFCSLSPSTTGAGETRGHTRTLLASASRDRLVHIFDTTNAANFRLIHTLDDHSASVTCLKMISAATLKSGESHEAIVVSAAADKSIIFRKLSLDSTGNICVQRYRHTQVSSSITSLHYNQSGEITGDLLVSSKDKRSSLRHFDVTSGKFTTQQTVESTGSEIVRIAQDSDGITTSLSSMDKSISIVETKSGKNIGVGHGHGEFVTGMSYRVDGGAIITSSADGCLFVWGIPATYQKQIVSQVATPATSSFPSSESPLRSVPADSIMSDDYSDSGDVEIPISNTTHKCVEVEFSDLFGNVGSVPPWMSGDNSRDDAQNGQWDDGNEWNERIDDERDAFATFDVAPMKGRRYTIEPSDLPPAAATETADEENEEKDEGENFGNFQSFDDPTLSSKSKSRRMSISSLFISKSSLPIEENDKEHSVETISTKKEEVNPTPSDPPCDPTHSSELPSSLISISRSPTDQIVAVAPPKKAVNEEPPSTTDAKKELEEQVERTREKLKQLGMYSSSRGSTTAGKSAATKPLFSSTRKKTSTTISSSAASSTSTSAPSPQPSSAVAEKKESCTMSPRKKAKENAATTSKGTPTRSSSRLRSSTTSTSNSPPSKGSTTAIIPCITEVHEMSNHSLPSKNQDSSLGLTNTANMERKSPAEILKISFQMALEKYRETTDDSEKKDYEDTFRFLETEIKSILDGKSGEDREQKETSASTLPTREKGDVLIMEEKEGNLSNSKESPPSSQSIPSSHSSDLSRYSTNIIQLAALLQSGEVILSYGPSSQSNVSSNFSSTTREHTLPQISFGKESPTNNDMSEKENAQGQRNISTLSKKMKGENVDVQFRKGGDSTNLPLSP